MCERLEVRESTYTAALLTTNGNRLLCPILEAKHLSHENSILVIVQQ